MNKQEWCLKKRTRQLRYLFDACGTDKGHAQRYEVPYAIFAEPYRYLNRPVRLLEIGIKEGSSLFAWQAWFRDVELFAVDWRAQCADKCPPTAAVFIGDQSKSDFWEETLQQIDGQFDIVIDDGSHRPRHQRTTFDALWPRVAVGGLYVIEDLHMSCGTGRREPDYSMLDSLLSEARGFVKTSRYKHMPPIYSFAGCACFITKPLP